MRVGYYAEVDGTIWPAIFDTQEGPVGLRFYGDAPPWPDFGRRIKPGVWHRRVERTECTRLFYVEAVAYIDRYPVELTRVRGDGTVEVSYYPGGYPSGPPGSRRDLGLSVPPGEFYENRGAGYLGYVPESALTHITERTHELGVEPRDRIWVPPHSLTLPPLPTPDPDTEL